LMDVLAAGIYGVLCIFYNLYLWTFNILFKRINGTGASDSNAALMGALAAHSAGEIPKMDENNSEHPKMDENNSEHPKTDENISETPKMDEKKSEIPKMDDTKSPYPIFEKVPLLPLVSAPNVSAHTLPFLSISLLQPPSPRPTPHSTPKCRR
jgi:hypothetical protein